MVAEGQEVSGNTVTAQGNKKGRAADSRRQQREADVNAVISDGTEGC